jgi:lipoprotein-anchoring transpeptidase ErfK/SrfK
MKIVDALIVFSLAGLVALAGLPDPAARRQAAHPKTSITFDPSVVNDGQTHDEVRLGAAGSAVVRLQILLDRAHFSPGEIDGRFGDNLRIALQGYQAIHQLPTGVVDADTWQSLNTDNAPALVPYTTTEADVAGPFQQIPEDMMQQAALKSLGYQSPEEELGERLHCNPKLLSALNPGKDLGTAGQEILVPNVQHGRMGPAARVVVSKTNGTVTALAADGAVLAQYPATTGSEHDPLPIGEWKIESVIQNPVFYYNPNLFWNAKPDDAKAKIAPGPNNPVGVVWIGISKEHYGIHGTPEPSKIGHAESHGCIRLTNWDAEELSQMVKPAIPAILQE